MRVVCEIDKPEVLEYLDVFETGDRWVKIKGCEACSFENRKKCCGECPMLTEKGCFFHLEGTNSKPFRCVVYPTPNTNLTWCSLEFQCVEGNNKGKIKRVKDV